MPVPLNSCNNPVWKSSIFSSDEISDFPTVSTAYTEASSKQYSLPAAGLGTGFSPCNCPANEK